MNSRRIPDPETRLERRFRRLPRSQAILGPAHAGTLLARSLDMTEPTRSGGTHGTPRHPVVRTVRWIAAAVLATWLLWMFLARGV
jgi:hypothetical protein